MRQQWYLAEGVRAEEPLAEIRRATRVGDWLTLPRHEEIVTRLAEGEAWDPRLWFYAPGEFAYAHKKAAAAALQVMNLDHPAADLVRAYTDAALQTVQTFAEVRGGNGRDAVRTNQVFTNWSINRFGLPSAQVLQEAYAVLKGSSDEDDPTASETLSAQGRPWSLSDVVDRCQQILEEAARETPSGSTHEWTVAVKPMLPAAAVSSARKVVWLSETAQWTSSDIARVLVHEVGAHAFRTINAQSAAGTIAGVYLGADAQATEEGLAVWWEHRLGLGEVAARRYAARVVAVDVACKGSITDVVEVLAQYLPRRAAAVIAVRVKRGLMDPLLPGAYTKDHVYASGHQMVRTFLAANGADRLPLVMATKWGLSCLPVVEKMHADGLFASAARLMPDERARGGL